MNSETESTLAERIKKCAHIAGSGDALANKTAIPRRTLETYLSGDAEPKASRLAAITKASGVNGNWLLSGEGPMLQADLQAPAPPGSLDPARLRLALTLAKDAARAAAQPMTVEQEADLVMTFYMRLDKKDR